MGSKQRRFRSCYPGKRARTIETGRLTDTRALSPYPAAHSIPRSGYCGLRPFGLLLTMPPLATTVTGFKRLTFRWTARQFVGSLSKPIDKSKTC
jgi:hypothetical protein